MNRGQKRVESRPADASPAAADMLGLYERMYTIRTSELRLANLFADGAAPGFLHLSVGQEAVPVGVSAALEACDTVASNHRGHGHVIARGLELDRFFLEIMGKAQGYCRGRGGSMHIADMSVGMLGANGIVGGGVPIALGSALAHQVRGNGAIAVAYFGDGALAEGALHESLNLAALWKLPLLLVCENNGWSEFSPTSAQFAAHVVDLAGAFGIGARSLDGNDVVAVAEAARSFAGELRAGQGPRLLECVTRRIRGHFEGDAQKYRPDLAAASLDTDDPLSRLSARLLGSGVQAAAIEAIERRVAAAVEAAVEAARCGEAPTFAAALADVYSPVPTHA
ncbi:MAG: thiamine pyrophosphate-dependent dehydrogenase E1 component subunit alpha [Caulobacterales bacterium]|nr:thiamine pyrophosphate-dependent dehydrogenase E1 component subunit alpha [Caulobacterales bacterium]